MSETPAPDILGRVSESVRLLQQAEELRKLALEQRRELCLQLHAAGMSYQRIGQLIGTDSGRVFRIVHRNAPPANPRVKRKPKGAR